MTTLREAAQQALEALAPWMDSDHTVQHAAYHALRAALAQQAEPVAGNTLLKEFLAAAKEAGVTHLRLAEPVAYRYKYSDGFWRFSNGKRVNGCDPIESQALYTAPPQQAEPVGKPEGEQPAGVVVGFTDEGRAIVDHDGLEEGWVLYTTPPQQAEPQTTHSSECWRWHHKCAVAKIERECKHD